MKKSRYEEYLAEREHIMNVTEAKDIVSCMRKLKDPVNVGRLIQKAIEYQEDIMPLVLKRYARPDMMFL